MDTRRIEVCVVLILCTGCLLSNAASLTVTSTPSPAILGSELVLRAIYTITDQSKPFRYIFFQGSDKTTYASFLSADLNGTSDWASTAPQFLKDRASVKGSQQAQFLEVRFRQTVCDDNGLQFIFKLSTGSSTSDEVIIDENISVTVEAAPQAPKMTVLPNSQNVTESTEMTFTCEGNVGNPAGSFQWYTFNDNEATPISNATAKALTTDPSFDTDDRKCSYKRTSVLKLNATRLQRGKRLVVRCRVNQAHGSNNELSCQNASTDYCQNSEQIDVQYPVSVNVGNPNVEVQEGTDFSKLCTTDGNPQAHRVEWRREGDNATLQTGNTLTLPSVTFNDTGNYICIAYNTIGGTSNQGLDTISLTVVKTTTPAPTTTEPTTPTTDGSTDGENRPNTAGDSDNLKIIIPVVVVAVLIAVIIIIVIVWRRRNKAKQIEEPKEKAFNNQAGINPMATRPDLVSNDRTFGVYDNTTLQKNEDGLGYAELQFDNKPRSRRPLAIDDSHTDYSDVSMPQV